jgi:hypothetical protein
MAGRILNRRELRKLTDEAELLPPTREPGPDARAPPAEKGRKAKSAAKPKTAKPRKKKEPVRLCVKWGVFDGGMKQVALFNFNQRAAADQKVADLTTKKNAVHFLQMVKEPMPEPEPAPVPLA